MAEKEVDMTETDEDAIGNLGDACLIGETFAVPLKSVVTLRIMDAWRNLPHGMTSPTGSTHEMIPKKRRMQAIVRLVSKDAKKEDVYQYDIGECFADNANNVLRTALDWVKSGLRKNQDTNLRVLCGMSKVGEEKD